MPPFSPIGSRLAHLPKIGRLPARSPDGAVRVAGHHVVAASGHVPRVDEQKASPGVVHRLRIGEVARPHELEAVDAIRICAARDVRGTPELG